MHKFKTAILRGLFYSCLILIAILSVTPAQAASTTGYLDLPASDPVPSGSGAVTNTMGAYNLPSKGNVTVLRSGAFFSSRALDIETTGVPADILKSVYLALGYNPSDARVPGVYHQVNNPAAPGSIVMTLPRPTSKLAIIIADVDSNGDTVTISAKDANGATITDLSGWSLLANGDMSVFTNGGGTDPAPAAAFTAATGVLASTDAANSNREFTVLQPNVRITELTFSYIGASVGSAYHVYYSLYSLPEDDLSLGDLIWQDSDNDGIVDPGENGIAGVDVDLHNASDDTLVQSDMTDADGKYNFTGLGEGQYYVKLRGSNFSSGGALYNFRSSSASGYETGTSGFVYHQDSGTEGATLTTDGVRTSAITLTYEGGSIVDGDTSYATYNTASFGLYDASPSPVATLASSGTAATIVRVGSWYALLPMLLAIATTASYVIYDWHRHRRPLHAENSHVNYTLWHHLRVVTIPLFRYRLSLMMSQTK